MGGFEVTICDLKVRPRRTPISALCLHRTRCRYALVGAEKQTRYCGQYRDHACLRSDARIASLKQNAGTAITEVGAQGRIARRRDRRCVADNSRTHESIATQITAHWIYREV